MPGPVEDRAERAETSTLAVTFGTFLKLLLAVALAWVLLKLWPPFCLLLVSVLIAITLSPLLAWLERRGVPHGAAVALLAALLLGLLVLAFTLVAPPLFGQIEALSARLPALRESLTNRIGGRHPWRRHAVGQLLDLPFTPQAAKWMHPMSWGPTVLEVLSGAGLVLVLSLYLLLDGRRVVAWLLAYVPRRHRRRMASMVPEVSAVVMAYTLGQLITSLLFAAFTFVLLTSLGVPAALPLALLAGACDVIPLVGILIATAPATILALTVSPATALLVLGTYLTYHLLESYLLVPRLYGDRLQLSTLGVLIALIVGGTLYGILGALLVLPLVAAYPVIERHWLSDYLGPEVLADHVALYETRGGPPPDVVDAVLNGERHGASRAAPAPSLGEEHAG